MEELVDVIKNIGKRLEAIEIEETYLRYSLEHLIELKENIEAGKICFNDKS